jgi:hypothetical protein
MPDLDLLGGLDAAQAGFGAAMAVTLVEDATLHRLWYDLRNQSLFDDSYRSDVLEIDQSLERMIWRIVSKIADLAGTPCPAARRTPFSTGCSSRH